MTDSRQKQVWDYMAAQLKTPNTSIREVFHTDNPQSQKYPYAVMKFGAADIDYKTFGADDHTISVTIMIYETDPEALRLLMETVYTLFHDATRRATLGATYNAALRPASRYAPDDNDAHIRKDIYTGFVFFDLDLRYTY